LAFYRIKLFSHHWSHGQLVLDSCLIEDLEAVFGNRNNYEIVNDPEFNSTNSLD
jgi:hypothetical protein